jgi:3-hydroxybutyryl-CoA dehydrogenase
MHVAAGLLGRKTGKGFYRYSSDKAEMIGLTTSPSMQADCPAIWCDPSDPVLREALLHYLTKTSAVADLGNRPAATSLCLVSPCGEDATNAALRLGLDPVRTVAVDAVSGWAVPCSL